MKLYQSTDPDNEGFVIWKLTQKEASDIRAKLEAFEELKKDVTALEPWFKNCNCERCKKIRVALQKANEVSK